MSKRFRTKLVLKLFPSVPKGTFAGKSITSLLEKHVFFREFKLSPWGVLFLAFAAMTLAVSVLGTLGLTWHSVHVTGELHAALDEREAEIEQRERAMRRARRDHALLLARLDPMNARVDELDEFARKLAVVTGLTELADRLGSTAEERSESLDLSNEEIAILERRFARLDAFLETQEHQLARTPSISPLKAAFVPTDRFGYRRNRFTRQAQGRGGSSKHFHAGLDLAAPVGTPIHATADGTVHFAGSIPARQNSRAAYYGNFVVIDHGNGMRTVFAHCDELGVQAGDEVQRGEVIAWVGSTGRSTGPHVHYEVVVNGRPMDPERFVLDIDIPERRVQVAVEDDHSFLLEEVDKLMGH